MGPGNYSSIQDAIDNASDGARVIISPFDFPSVDTFVYSSSSTLTDKTLLIVHPSTDVYSLYTMKNKTYRDGIEDVLDLIKNAKEKESNDALGDLERDVMLIIN